MGLECVSGLKNKYLFEIQFNAREESICVYQYLLHNKTYNISEDTLMY